MWIRMIMTLVLAVLAGCATVDRMNLSKFEPLRSDATHQHFKYTVTGNSTGMAVDSADAERERMEWLQTWLDENGLQGKKYEVVSRTPVTKGPSLFGQVHEIFYEVKVQR